AFTSRYPAYNPVSEVLRCATLVSRRGTVKIYDSASIRNVGLLSHMGNGKTSLAEAFLFNSNAVNRLGRVDEGTTVSDFDPDEQRRRMSVNLAIRPVEWKGCKINVVDAPGYFDY